MADEATAQVVKQSGSGLRPADLPKVESPRLR